MRAHQFPGEALVQFEGRHPGKQRKQMPILQLLAHWHVLLMQAGPHQNYRLVQVLVISPLLTSLLRLP